MPDSERPTVSRLSRITGQATTRRDPRRRCTPILGTYTPPASDFRCPQPPSDDVDCIPADCALPRHRHRSGRPGRRHPVGRVGRRTDAGLASTPTGPADSRLRRGAHTRASCCTSTRTGAACPAIRSARPRRTRPASAPSSTPRASATRSGSRCAAAARARSSATWARLSYEEIDLASRRAATTAGPATRARHAAPRTTATRRTARPIYARRPPRAPRRRPSCTTTPRTGARSPDAAVVGGPIPSETRPRLLRRLREALDPQRRRSTRTTPSSEAR